MRDLNFKYLAEGKKTTVTARFGPDGITTCDPNRAGEGASAVFPRIYELADFLAPRQKRRRAGALQNADATQPAPFRSWSQGMRQAKGGCP